MERNIHQIENEYNNKDWIWVVLHGNEQVVEENVKDVGKKLGIYCVNSFQVLSRTGGGGSN